MVIETYYAEHIGRFDKGVIVAEYWQLCIGEADYLRTLSILATGGTDLGDTYIDSDIKVDCVVPYTIPTTFDRDVVNQRP